MLFINVLVFAAVATLACEHLFIFLQFLLCFTRPCTTPALTATLPPLPTKRKLTKMASDKVHYLQFSALQKCSHHPPIHCF